LLFNLLPGLREIRAPLISGYLWLVFFFLTLHGKLPSTDDPDSALKPIFRIGEDLTTAGLVAVTGVAAYLVGSAMQELWKLMSRLFSPARPLYGEAGIRTSTAGREDVRHAVRSRMQSVTGLLSQVAVSPGEKGIAEEPEPEAIERELPLIRTLLLGERPELVGELDRLQAEADLRVTVAFPLAFLAIYLALEASVGWIALLLPSALLLVQGYQRQLDAGDLLAKALKIGKADAPTLESLTSGAEAVLQRVELEAELRRRMEEGEGLAAFQLGNLQASWDDFDTAAVSLEFAVEKGIVRACAELGLVYERRGEDDKAERAYRDGVQRRDEKSQARLAELLQRLDRGEEARVAAATPGEAAVAEADDDSAAASADVSEYRQRMLEGDSKAALNLALYFRRQGDEEQAVSVLRQATEMNPDDPQVWIELADAHRAQERFRPAHEALGHALRLQQAQLGDPEHLDIAATLSQMGILFAESAEYVESRALLEKALRIRESQLGEDHPAVAESLVDLALVKERFDEFEEAWELEERAFTILRKVGDRFGWSRVMANMGWNLRERGFLDRAQVTVEEALSMQEAMLPAENPQAARIRITLGAVLTDRGENAKAQTQLEEAVEAVGVAGRARHFADALRELGRNLTASGEAGRALSFFEQALQIETDRLSSWHPQKARTLMEKGAATRQLGDSLESERSYRQALQIFDENPERAPVALCCRGLGETLMVSGREAEAMESISRAVQIQEQVLRRGHPELVRSYESLAKVLELMGRADEARDARAKAAEMKGGY
jgi:tetratricopeptide (TPR) repeat protein